MSVHVRILGQISGQLSVISDICTMITMIGERKLRILGKINSKVFGKHPFILSQVFFSLISFDKSDTFQLTRNVSYVVIDRWEGGQRHLLGTKNVGKQSQISCRYNILIRWEDV